MARLAGLAALALAAACAPAAAQQVVGHVPLLPRDAGLNPLGFGVVVPDPGASRVYVLGASGLTLVDRAADSFRSLALGDPTLSTPRDLALDAGRSRLYVSDPGLGQIAVVEAATGAVLARKGSLPFLPGSLAYQPAGNLLYVLEEGGGRVAALDLGSLSLHALADLGQPASRIAVNPANGLVYVTSFAAGLLHVLGPRLNLVAQVSGLAQARALAVRPGVGPLAGKVYVVREDGNVAVVNADTGALITSVAATGARLVVAATTGYAYVAGQSASLTVLDPADVRSSVAIGGTPAPIAAAGLALGTDGHLYVTDLTQITRARVTRFDVAAGAPVRIGAALTGRGGVAAPAFSPATSRLYVADGATRALSEVEPTTLAPTSLVLGTALDGGAMNDAAQVSFTLDLASGQAVAVDLALAPTAPLNRIPVGDLPWRAAIAEAAGEVYVVNQNSRSLSVLDASGQMPAALRTVTGLPHDLTLGFAVDRTVAGGPKGFLSNLVFPPQTIERDFLQAYQPGASDALRGISGTCGVLTTCAAGLAIAVDEVNHRFYTPGLALNLLNPDLTLGIVVYDTDLEVFRTKLNYTDPAPLQDAASLAALLVLHVDPAPGQTRVFLPERTAAGGFRVVMVTDATPAPPAVDIATAGLVAAFAAAGTTLYAAEPAAGLVEAIDTSLAPPAVTLSYPTGGAPVALARQPGNDLLFVANDGLEPPAVQVYGTASGGDATLSDLGFGGATGAFLAGPSGRIAFANNRHGSIAVLDPSLAGADLQIAAQALPDGVTVRPYPTTGLQVTGGTGPYAFEVTSGALPPGLALDAATGEIGGQPTATGAWSFMVRVTDEGQAPPRQDLQGFQLQVLDLLLLTSSLPEGLCNQPYAVALLAAGGTPPYTFRPIALPSWAALDAAGLLAGTPTAPESCLVDNVQVEVTDADGTTVAGSFCLGVGAGGPYPAVGNSLRAVRLLDDVVLSLVLPPIPGGGYNLYRSSDPAALGTRLGPSPSTTTETYPDQDVVGDGNRYFYQARNVDGCGTELP